LAEGWVPRLAEHITAPIHRDRQTVRARTAADLFLGRGRPGHGEFRLSYGLIHTSRQLLVHASQVGPLGRRSLQQLAARTALSGTDRVFHCRAGHCTRPPRNPPVGRGWHQRIHRPVPSAAIAGIQMNSTELHGESRSRGNDIRSMLIIHGCNLDHPADYHNALRPA
jgi:hypothetical protein